MADAALHLAALLVLLATCSTIVAAQVPTGSITGTVRDAQGLPIEDAAIALTNLQTNASYTSRTGSLGGYQFERIDHGLYRVTVAKDGFKNGVVNTIKLDASTVYSVVPITLEVGSPTQTVTVEAGAESVQTTSAAVTGTVEKKQIDDLPILDRNPLALLGLQAGVSASLPNELGAITTTISGQRVSFSNMTVDGINIQDNFIRDNALDFSPNQPFSSQSQEFTIINQNGEVENGGGSSQVSIVTPKGTNQFHGEGFWYYRTNAWAANDWFNNASGVALPKLLQNQGGGNIGGPIIRNKLFIYGYYELLRTRAQATNETTVLSPTILSALSSGTPTAPFTYQPVDANGNSAGGPQTVDLLTVENQARGPVASGGSPVFTPDPAMLQLIARIPATFNNTRVGDGVNLLGYQLNARNNTTEDNYGFRADYDLNAHNSLTATYSWNRQIVDRPDIDTSFDKVPLVQNNDTIHFLSTAWRWSPRSDFTNEVRFGLNRTPAFFTTSQKFGSYVLDDNGINCPCLPFTDPNPNFLPQGRNTHTWSWQDNASWSKGNHTLKFGTQIERVTVFTTGSGGIYPTYSIGFSTSNPYGPLTSDFPAPANSSISSSALANATQILQSVTGFLSQVTQTLNATSQTSGYIPLAPENRNYSQNDWSFYLGDTWRIKPRLTLTLGTRWEYFSPVNERDGLFLLPVVAPGETVQQSLLGNAAIDFAGGPSKRPLYRPRMSQFAPNVGVAWDPFGNGKTAVRAGFSMNYVNDQFFTAAANAAAGNTGLAVSPVNPNLSGPTVSNPQGAQTITAPPFQIPTSFMTNADNLGIPVAAYAIDPGLKSPYVEQWNLSIQRDIGWNTSLTVSYVGNHGVGLFRAIDVNQLLLQQNGFLADFNRARSNGFLALGANPAGGFVPDYNPGIPGSQPLQVFPNLFGGGFIDNPTISNLIYQGQVGTLSGLYHANGFDEGNNPVPGPGDPVTLFPNPFLLGGDLLKNGSFSTYHAGVVEVRRRFSKGLYFQANYTYSKVMTDYAGAQSQFQPYQDNARPGLERQRAPFDLTHAFKANFTYELPIGKGHRLLASDNRILGLLVNGWQTASIFTWQSGAPFSILSEWGSFNRGLRIVNNTAVATLTHQQISGDVGTFEQPNGVVYIINPKLVSSDGTGVPTTPQLACAPAVQGGFCNPQPGEVGNLQLNAFNGPTYFNWDASAGKDLNLTEHLKLTFRAEAFNVLNHPVFSTNAFDGISATEVNEELINSNTFGQSTSTISKPRRLQLSLRLKF